MTKPQLTSQSHHLIQWISVVGGFLDGLRLEFGPGLNCVIGGRGTGKTTVLELIRFALDALPDDPDAQKRVRALVAKNLDFGRVELGILTSSGMAYVVSRSKDEEPVVLTADREPTDLVLRSGNLFKADIFSQNQVESIADRSDSQLGLIDSFELGPILDLSQRAGHLCRDIDGQAKQIAQMTGAIEALRNETGELSSIEEQLKGMGASGQDDGAATEQAHQEKSLRDREKRAMDRVGQRIGEYGRELKAHLGALADETRSALSADLFAGPNRASFEVVQQSMNDTGMRVDGCLEQALEALADCWNQVQEQAKALVGAHGAQEVAYRQLLEQHQTALGEATKRSGLDKRRNHLLEKRAELEQLETKKAELVSGREDLLRQLSALRQDRFSRRHTICEQLTSSLASSDIRVLLQQDGNKDLYRQRLDELLKGSRTHDSTKERLVESLFPVELVQLAMDGDVTALIDRAELTQSTAERVISSLKAREDVQDLETVELVDQPKIELLDGDQWKDSKELSTGQKCTAILPILLLESEKPLLIDQPEDNLDNRYVSAKVVSTISAVKQQRQLILVTHNPNIPVLGDAEQVVVLDSNGSAARLLQSGTVDDCRAEIVNLLEGGEQAFELRAERYHR
jgi:ABC-type lipoprotein export system ATPase subunit